MHAWQALPYRPYYQLAFHYYTLSLVPRQAGPFPGLQCCTLKKNNKKLGMDLGMRLYIHIDQATGTVQMLRDISQLTCVPGARVYMV